MAPVVVTAMALKEKTADGVVSLMLRAASVVVPTMKLVAVVAPAAKVPVVEMFMALKEKVDDGVVSLMLRAVTVVVPTMKLVAVVAPAARVPVVDKFKAPNVTAPLESA